MLREHSRAWSGYFQQNLEIFACKKMTCYESTCSRKFFWRVCCAVFFCCTFFYVLLHCSTSRPVERPLLLLPGEMSNITRNVSFYLFPDRNTTLLQPHLSKLLSRNHSHHDAAHCNPYLLVFVHSAITSTEARAAIRGTWARRDAVLSRPVLVLFVMGEWRDDEQRARVLAEQRRYGDLIVEPFIDVYVNLTLKSLFMLKWTLLNCRPQHVLKCDEDVFVHVPNLLRVLALVDTASDQHFASSGSKVAGSGRTVGAGFGEYSGPVSLLGALICGAKPDRRHESKYYMPRGALSASRYPNYLSGTGYVLTGAAVRPLWEAALRQPLLHLEDVFVTGVCARVARLRPVDHAGFSYEPRRLSSACVLQRLVTAHQVTPADMLVAWRVATTTPSSSTLQCPTGSNRTARARSLFERSYRPVGCH